MFKYFLIAIISCLFSSFSQILLKKSALIERDTVIKQYMNLYVIGGYFIIAVCMGLTIWAYKGMPYKYGAVIESTSYLYVMILSRLFIKEKITRKKVIGNLIIITGIAIFSLGG